MFTDTDSLVYEIKTDDVYEYFYRDKNLYDFSDYPQNSKFFDFVNKRVIGKIKDEYKEKIISEFAGLKSKMYYLVDVDDKENKKENESIGALLKTQDLKNLLMFCLIKKMMRHRMKKFKVDCIKLKLLMFVKFFSSCLMIKDIY